MERSRRIVTVLEPEDDDPHEPDAAANDNESMYLNAFDVDQQVGGWFRLAMNSVAGSRSRGGRSAGGRGASAPGGTLGRLAKSFIGGRRR